MDAICAVGNAPDASVAALTQAAMVAWAETMVRDDSSRLVDGGQRPASGSSSSGSSAGGSAGGPKPRLRMGLDGDGNVVAGLASWDAAERLFATEKRAEELLLATSSGGSGGGGRGGAALHVSVRLKNFQLLWSN